MRIPLLAILLGSVAFGVSAQEQTTLVKSKGAHHRDLELITTDVTPRGEKTFSTNQVVELANGLHYWDGKEWQTSDPVFVNTDQGAVAYKVPYQLTISPDLMEEGVVPNDNYSFPESFNCRSTREDPHRYLFHETLLP